MSGLRWTSSAHGHSCFPLQLLFIAAVTPIMHDFYNYDPSSPEFLQEFVQFLKASWAPCL